MTEKRATAGRPRNIAFIGLGIMGSAMARNLALANNHVRGWNRTARRAGADRLKEAGLEMASSIESAVEDCDYIFTCVTDSTALCEVLLGANGVLGSAKPGALVIDTSTIGQAAAREISGKLKCKGLRFVDAPVTGGDVGAREGTLTILVGGEKEDVEEARPLLQVLGKNIHYCGPAGSGQAVKLCNQILCAVNMVAVSEALTLAEQLGVEKSLVVESLGQGAGGSWALSNLGARIVRSDWEPGFMLKDMLKDLSLVKKNVPSNRAPLPGVELAERLFEEAKLSDPERGERQGTQSMFNAYKKNATVRSKCPG